jgi:hypothetical protein
MNIAAIIINKSIDIKLSAERRGLRSQETQESQETQDHKVPGSNPGAAFYNL